MAGPKPLASVTRAITIVEFLARADEQGFSLAAIASALEINKATAYATLFTLREQNWVEQVPETGNYRLGEGISTFARYQTTSQRVKEMIRPTLVTISQDFNELVHLGTLSGYRVRYLDKVEPNQAVRVVSRVGEVAVAARTALGRSLIGSDPERRENYERFLSDPALAGDGVTDIEKLRQAVLDNFERLDRCGWTQEIGENQPSICCVAVPLYYKGSPDYAISVTTPQDRMPPEVRAKLAEGIAQQISRLPEDSPFSVKPVR